MPPKKAKTTTDSGEITVRMFCQGLGDCFLISIPQEKAKPYSILIDCGVAKGTPGSNVMMPRIANEIRDLTGGVVDLLVVTHEHWDHVSGFLQAETELNTIQFNNLWFAWTEDESDPVTQELDGTSKKARAALVHAAHMAASPSMKGDPKSARMTNALNGVLAFYGVGASGDGMNDLDRAMAIARSLVEKTAGKKAVQCLKPGNVLPLPGATSSVRAYILGPPHSADAVHKINPSKSKSETYEKEAHLATPGISWSWRAALAEHSKEAGLSADPSDAANFNRSMPFDGKWRVPLQKAKSQDFFKKHYFAPMRGEQERRIDGDWLWRGAQQLALQLESYTNNTSLVIALELVGSGKVLLFAGDAQVGNWLSWHEHDFKPEAGRIVKAAELLSRTVLYKVGHHGSHNATLREKGLEMMTHPDLVAMLPVEKTAVERLGYGEMPLKSLLKVLDTKTKGRVLQVDKPWKNGVPAPGTWTGLKTARLERREGEPLYMEYKIADH